MYFRELKYPEQTIKAMIKYKMLPQHIESVFIQNILKIFTFIIRKYEMNDQSDDALRICDLVCDKLNESIKSGELEVQERASTSLMIIKIVKEEFAASKLILFLV